MDLQIIKKIVEENRFSGGIRGLAETVGMTEQNLHRCVRENKIQAGDLEKIAKALGVPITVFFDEGRGSVTVSATDHSQAAGRDLHVATDDALMAERVKYLEAIVREKDERISELKERIEDLKTK